MIFVLENFDRIMTGACHQTIYEDENNDMVFKETKIKNIKEVTETLLKEEIVLYRRVPIILSLEKP